MNTLDILSGLEQYVHSKFSAADDKRLRQLIKDIPDNIILDVSSDHYGFTRRLSAQKIAPNKWQINDNWFYDSESKTHDALVSHLLITMFRDKRPKYDCKQAAE